MNSRKIIAIDGPVASGKGTLSKLLAQKLGFEYLDTGLIYRSLAHLAIIASINPDNPAEILKLIPYIDLADQNLRSPEVSAMSSKVSAHKEVRQALVALQHNYRLDASGLVVDGRDIGTVIFPNAECKFFITASVKERAFRRWKQLQLNDKYAKYDSVLQDLILRDKQDSQRQASPLYPASDAYILDTSEITIEEAVSTMSDIAMEKLHLY